MNIERRKRMGMYCKVGACLLVIDILLTVVYQLMTHHKLSGRSGVRLMAAIATVSLVAALFAAFWPRKTQQS